MLAVIRSGWRHGVGKDDRPHADGHGTPGPAVPPARSSPATAGHLGLGASGCRQDDPRGQLSGDAAAPRALVSARRGRRRRGDVLLLSGSGRAPPPPCAAAPDCRVPCGPARVRAALLPRALQPAEAALHRRLRQLPGRAARGRAPRRHGGDGRRDPGRRAPRLHQPQRSAAGLRPSPRPPAPRDPRWGPAPLHADGGGGAGPEARAGPLVAWDDPRAVRHRRRLVRRSRAAAGAAPFGRPGIAGPTRVDVGDPVRLLRGRDLQEGRSQRPGRVASDCVSAPGDGYHGRGAHGPAGCWRDPLRAVRAELLHEQAGSTLPRIAPGSAGRRRASSTPQARSRRRPGCCATPRTGTRSRS
jgi:hypothetical protein